eukprot:2912957-Prymnesium_polylepis.1
MPLQLRQHRSLRRLVGVRPAGHALDERALVEGRVVVDIEGRHRRRVEPPAAGAQRCLALDDSRCRWARQQLLRSRRQRLLPQRRALVGRVATAT